MPPQRTRNVVEDSRSEASSSKEKYTNLPGPAHTIPKGRRNGNATSGAGSTLKDVSNATQSALPIHDAHDDAPKIAWSSFDASVLHAYRQAHTLDVAPAFTNSYNQRMLTRPGVGQLSPTMVKAKSHRRVSKEVLATVVRKDFNDAMVLESDIITHFLYAVHHQDQSFRMRFEPRPR